MNSYSPLLTSLCAQPKGGGDGGHVGFGSVVS